MIYPPRAAVDEQDHAARVLLLAEACADIPAEWLEYARMEWVKTQPFFPRACELREIALAYGRLQTRALPAPRPAVVEPSIAGEQPLTPEEIEAMPAEMRATLRRMAEGVGAADWIKQSNVKDYE